MSMANETANLTEKDTTNFFIRIIKAVIPWKGDGKNEIMRKILFIGSIVLFVFSVGELAKYLSEDKANRSYVQQVAKEYEPDFSDSVSLGNNGGTDKGAAAPTGQNSSGKREIQGWAEKLLKKNSDVRGWIKIPGFKDSEEKEYINFPVLQGKDNEYYLYKNLDKQYYESGSIFIDWAAKIDKDKVSDNLTIYGHNMRYVGTSFTHLNEYKQGAEFVSQFPIIEFNTIYDSGCKYIVIGAFIANVYENQDNGKVFNYNAYRDFEKNGEYSFDNWINEVKKRSWFKSDIKCTEKDKYITLSTCSNECSDLRWVVVARKVTENDDLDKLAASYKDKQDKDIYFPACWTDVYGNNKKYFGWDY